MFAELFEENNNDTRVLSNDVILVSLLLTLKKVSTPFNTFIYLGLSSETQVSNNV